MSKLEPYEVKFGDRLRLSEVGRRHNPRIRSHFGTVVQVGGIRYSSTIVVIRFDGNVSITRMHRSYLEPVPAE